MSCASWTIAVAADTILKVVLVHRLSGERDELQQKALEQDQQLCQEGVMLSGGLYYKTLRIAFITEKKKNYGKIYESVQKAFSLKFSLLKVNISP